MLTRRTFASILAASTGAAKSITPVRDKLQALIDSGEVPGAITLVATRDGIEHLLVQGHADAARTLPLKKNSVFAIASMTKPIVGTAVMMMHDAGKLSIEDPVAKHIPELAPLGPLTIRHLMTHTSGMGEATPAESAAARSLKDIIPAYAAKPVAFAPGTQWKYCQSGINTLGRIVEIVSGLGIDTFFEQRIFSPLGMKSSGFYPGPALAARLTKMCVRKDGRLEDAPDPRFQHNAILSRERAPFPNGGLFSTAEDYSRFARMILNGGEFKGRRYVSEASVRLMTSPHTGSLKAGFIPGSAWGLTWGVVTEPQGVTANLSKGTFGHGGAFGTQAWIDPVKGRAHILMIQRSGIPNSDASPMRQAFHDAAG